MKNATETAKEAQRPAEIAMDAASDTRGLYRCMATSFDDSEVALNEELGGMDKNKNDYGHGYGDECDVEWNRRPGGNRAG